MTDISTADVTLRTTSDDAGFPHTATISWMLHDHDGTLLDIGRRHRCPLTSNIPLCQLTLLDWGLLSLQFPHYVTAA
ncbi:MAG: hypothetical protein ACRDPO_33675 [Streptosporangiaceae bacterium]